MKKIRFILTAFLMVSAFTYAQTEKDQEILDDAQKAKERLLQKDVGLEEFFENSAGYAIFPNVGKGGLIIGGASGNGVLYENGVAVGMADLKEFSIGFKAGGKAVIEVIFFETADDLREFKYGEFEFGAEASAVALKSGVAVNYKFSDGTAVFTLPKAGLMADASVEGQKFGFSPFVDKLDKGN